MEALSDFNGSRLAFTIMTFQHNLTAKTQLFYSVAYSLEFLQSHSFIFVEFTFEPLTLVVVAELGGSVLLFSVTLYNKGGIF